MLVNKSTKINSLVQFNHNEKKYGNSTSYTTNKFKQYSGTI